MFAGLGERNSFSYVKSDNEMSDLSIPSSRRGTDSHSRMTASGDWDGYMPPHGPSSSSRAWAGSPGGIGAPREGRGKFTWRQEDGGGFQEPLLRSTRQDGARVHASATPWTAAHSDTASLGGNMRGGINSCRVCARRVIFGDCYGYLYTGFAMVAVVLLLIEVVFTSFWDSERDAGYDQRGFSGTFIAYCMLDISISMFYCVELGLRLVSVGSKEFLKISFNKFEMVVIVCCFISSVHLMLTHIAEDSLALSVTLEIFARYIVEMSRLLIIGRRFYQRMKVASLTKGPVLTVAAVADLSEQFAPISTTGPINALRGSDLAAVSQYLADVNDPEYAQMNMPDLYTRQGSSLLRFDFMPPQLHHTPPNMGRRTSNNGSGHQSPLLGGKASPGLDFADLKALANIRDAQ